MYDEKRRWLKRVARYPMRIWKEFLFIEGFVDPPPPCCCVACAIWLTPHCWQIETSSKIKLGTSSMGLGTWVMCLGLVWCTGVINCSGKNEKWPILGEGQSGKICEGLTEHDWGKSFKNLVYWLFKARSRQHIQFLDDDITSHSTVK